MLSSISNLRIPDNGQTCRTGSLNHCLQANRDVPRNRFSGACQKEKVLEKDRGSDMDDGQPRPIQYLFAEPMFVLFINSSILQQEVHR
jgi:hypothetical protein